MVHLAIENLLSSCTNRPLYEALWFMAFTKNSRPENFENESVEAICNELIARVRQDDINARSFLISTNLAYGTVRLYKTQVDKLYEQVKFALQSCSTAFNHMDWFTQMTQVTSTPIVHPKTPRTQKTVKQTQTTIRRKTAKKTQPAPKLLDDFDLIESIYNIVDEDEDVFMATPAPKGRKSAGISNDTGIGLDPTMASDVHAITIREPTKTFMTSGYQSMLNYEDDDVFGSKIGDEFQTFLKETEDTIMSQDEIIQETTNLLTTVKSRKRTKIVEESIEIKRRRLTYMNNDESGSVLRNANADQPVPNIDIYQPEVPFEMDEASTFYESLNATEATNRHNQRSMLKSTINIDPMDIEEPSIAMTTFNEPTIPNTTFNEESTLHNNTDTLLENMTLNEPTTILDNDATMIPEVPVSDVPMKEPEILPQESEFILDEIPKFVKQNRVRKSRNLITDKQIMMPLDNVKKGIQHYKEKYTGISPFADFQRRMHYYRSCTDVLFSTGSFLLKKSPLHKLYVRNMKKVPEKMLKQQLKENGKQLSEIKNLRRSSRPAIPIYDLKKKLNNDIEGELEDIPQVLDPKDIEMKEIRPTLPDIDDVLVDKENISPDIVRISKRSSRSRKCKKVLKESNNIDVEMQELELPEIQPNLGIEMYKDQQMEELPPALDFENIEINNVVMRDIEAEDKERINRKKVVLKKLASFWKQSDKLITMEKICNGMLRSEAAGTFYELLLLAKRCVVELVHKTDSLEISNILCKISTSQLSKELYNQNINQV